MTIDVAKVRADTPACESIVHFNNAGASLTPDPVLDVVAAYLAKEAAIGGYEAEAAEADLLEDVYTASAELLGCGPDELAFTGGASEAWWRAFTSIPLMAGDRVVIDHAAYNSNVFGVIQAQRRGVEVTVVPDDAAGQLDVAALTGLLDDTVKVVAVTHVPTSSGLVNPAAAVGEALAGSEILYLLDACQSVGQLPVDVGTIGCDVLSLTGRKFLRAPRGTGMLYVNRDRLGELLDPGFIDSRSAVWTDDFEYELLADTRRYELFEAAYAAKAGFGTAVRYALDLGLDEIAERIGDLSTTARSLLGGIAGVTVRDQGEQQCGIVTFTIDGHEPGAIVERLRAAGINTSLGSRLTAQLDLGGRGIDSIVRASIHYYNTTEELDCLAEEVTKISRS